MSVLNGARPKAPNFLAQVSLKIGNKLLKELCRGEIVDGVGQLLKILDVLLHRICMSDHRKGTKLPSEVVIAKFMLRARDEMIPINEWVRSLVLAKPCQSCSVQMKICDIKLAMIANIVVREVLFDLDDPTLRVGTGETWEFEARWRSKIRVIGTWW